MSIFFIFVTAIFLTVYMLSKNKYNDIIDELDKKEYPLKSLMPMGLYIMKAVGYKYNTKYDQYIKQKLINLHTTRNDNYYLKLFWVNKVTYLMVVLLIIGLFGAGIKEVSREFIFFAIILIFAVFYGMDKDLDKKIEDKNRLIRLDFPSFMNEISLLINAGMTLPKAWEKIVKDNRDNNRPLYKELEYTYFEIKSGKAQQKAYEDFAKRCRTPEITKFISIVLQNLKRGNAQLSMLLRVLGAECWEIRKNTAKKLGEEASSKLLMPMMLMFIGILLIMMLPAVLQLQNI
ncbi:type II secretion system F family protein [Abyssisolibacter fermentans]|uniref:type II secretion system F family protein n=1 Tax=Abyssisolibacter fermentans TaxID=1766203 RepID=UPI0008377B17|nr:type II secretion system F family protein [Abyssisolibacter fermentans]